jgi:SAM-dependent methyltransferase
VLVGCVVGCSPLFGLHIFVCIALAWLLRLNQFVVYGAANISIPPMIPFIGFASVQLGERLLHGRWLHLTTADFQFRDAGAMAYHFFVDWLVGGLFVGGAVGIFAGALVWRVVASRREDPMRDEIDRASQRYAGLPRKYRVYAAIKYRLDPCYRAIAPLVPAGSFTVDLGTGLGMLPVLLGLRGCRALGVEWDAEKAACGKRAAAGLDGVEVVEGDARAFALPECDVVTLVDLLHYYDADAQRALLARCKDALRPGGRLLVREGDRARAGGARWTRFVERMVTRLGWNRGPQVRFRPVEELRADLESLGFAVRVDEVAGKLHPGNVLLIAERA